MAKGRVARDGEQPCANRCLGTKACSISICREKRLLQGIFRSHGITGHQVRQSEDRCSMALDQTVERAAVPSGAESDQLLVGPRVVVRWSIEHVEIPNSR